MTTRKDTCSGCRFYQAPYQVAVDLSDSGGVKAGSYMVERGGECRKSHPDPHYGCAPVTPDYWCGEFEEKPEPVEALRVAHPSEGDLWACTECGWTFPMGSLADPSFDAHTCADYPEDADE